MKLRHLVLVITALLAVSLAIPTAADTLGEDEVGGVSLSPHEGPNGEYATVEDDEIRIDAGRINDQSRTRLDDVFTVTATGESEQTVWLRSSVDGVSFYRNGDPSQRVSGVELSPGETIDVGVAVHTDAGVGDGTFTVEVRTADGPEIEVTDVSLNRTEIRAGQGVAVTATVTNGGDAEGSRTLALGVDGVAVAQRTVTVSPGGSRTVTFERSFDRLGEYEIDVDGRSGGTVTVTGGDSGEAGGVDAAAFAVRDVTLSETSVRPGGSVEVTATIDNEGAENGTFTAELHVGGAVVETREVAVPAGGSETVTFTRQFSRSGTYRVGVSGVEAGGVDVEDPSGFGLLPSERTLRNPATGTVATTLVFGAFVFGRTRVRDLLEGLR